MVVPSIAPEFSFTTGTLAPLPNCTSLISPFNGETNVPLTPLIQWQAVPNATGYRVTIGDTPGGNNVLDNATLFTNETFVIDFEPNSIFFITIVPFNNGGDAIGCQEESFSTLVGCGPFFDTNTGQLIDLRPELVIDDTYSFCEGETPLTLQAPSGADGYRWFRIDDFGNEQKLSEETTVSITDNGNYFLEAYTIVSDVGNSFECPTNLPFSVVSSSVATIDNIGFDQTATGFNLNVNSSGIGAYEYALTELGPYQDSPNFFNVAAGEITVFVRDKNGCGVTSERLEIDLTVEGFPKFFTPNGDDANDFWQYINPPNSEPKQFVQIMIFDRYGKLLKQISQNSVGWDGTYVGRPMPAGDYWFSATDTEAKVYKGHFTLKDKSIKKLRFGY